MVSPARADAFPEVHQYTDVGCELHPSCLTCPAPLCRHDTPKGLQGVRMLLHMEQVLALATEAQLSPQEAALSLGISDRTYYRLLRKARGIVR